MDMKKSVNIICRDQKTSTKDIPFIIVIDNRSKLLRGRRMVKGLPETSERVQKHNIAEILMPAGDPIFKMVGCAYKNSNAQVRECSRY